jgi:hypothetical protein
MAGRWFGGRDLTDRATACQWRMPMAVETRVATRALLARRIAEGRVLEDGSSFRRLQQSTNLCLRA